MSTTTMIRRAIKALALIAMTLAIVVAISSINSSYQQQREQISARDVDHVDHEVEDVLSLPSKRVSRFLAENNNDFFQLHGRILKPADHCHKDYEVCDIRYGKNYSCCGNKCFDLTIDKKHCGSCHNKCKFTDDCCDGKCVNKAYDKRHCGRCNKKCIEGQYCVYGMCDYA